MKKQIYIALIIVYTLNSFSQDTVSKTSVFIDFGLSSFVPKKSQEKFYTNNNEFYRDEIVYNIQTYGYNGAFGVAYKLNNSFDIMGKLTYDYVQTSKITSVESACGICYIYNPKNGISTNKSEYHILTLDPVISYHYKKINFENSLGYSHLVWQVNKYYEKDFIQKREFNSVNHTKDFFGSVYSSHKIGVEVAKGRLYILGGVNLFYTKVMSQNINTQLSLRIRI